MIAYIVPGAGFTVLLSAAVLGGIVGLVLCLLLRRRDR
jgi:hypothetical protein